MFIYVIFNFKSLSFRVNFYRKKSHLICGEGKRFSRKKFGRLGKISAVIGSAEKFPRFGKIYQKDLKCLNLALDIN